MITEPTMLPSATARLKMGQWTLLAKLTISITKHRQRLTPGCFFI